jgi:hypothetical protein
VLTRTVHNIGMSAAQIAGKHDVVLQLPQPAWGAATDSDAVDAAW